MPSRSPSPACSGMLASDAPVLICVDDLQWLDAQTAAVLAFAARRLPPAGVGVLMTLRTEPATPEPGWWPISPPRCR